MLSMQVGHTVLNIAFFCELLILPVYFHKKHSSSVTVCLLNLNFFLILWAANHNALSDILINIFN